MTPQGKRALIIISSLLLIGGTVGYILWDRKKKKDAEAKLKAEEDAKKVIPPTPEPQKGGGAKSPNDTKVGNDFWSAYASAKRLGSPTFIFEGKTYDGKTGRVYVPKIEGDTAIGKYAYPLGTYVNVRSAPRSADGVLDNTNLGKVNSPNVIGTVKNTTWGTDKFRWYELDLLTPLIATQPAGTTAKTGWVRADVVKFK